MKSPWVGGGESGKTTDLGFGLGITEELAFDREQGQGCYYLTVMVFEQTKHIFPAYNKEHLYALTH